jgi:hypothetical protein
MLPCYALNDTMNEETNMYLDLGPQSVWHVIHYKCLRYKMSDSPMLKMLLSSFALSKEKEMYFFHMMVK